jgi:predicted nucleic acid-binding protein
LRVIYDTNILLQILRKADSIERLQTQIGYQYLEECISIVTVAEIRSLANQFNWGSIRDLGRSTNIGHKFARNN